MNECKNSFYETILSGDSYTIHDAIPLCYHWIIEGSQHTVDFETDLRFVFNIQ